MSGLALKTSMRSSRCGYLVILVLSGAPLPSARDRRNDGDG